jgi:hypothetical protein
MSKITRQQLVPIIAMEDVQISSIDALNVSEVCSVLGWLADQQARLVARLQPVPRLTLKHGEAIREMRVPGGERCVRYANRAVCMVISIRNNSLGSKLNSVA